MPERRILLLLTILTMSVCSCRQDRSHGKELRSEADLTGLTISTSAGNYFDTKYSGREDVTLFRVNSEVDGVQAVHQGIADVFVTDEVAIPKDARERLKIKLAFRGEEVFDVAFAIRKGDDKLREQLDSFIVESRADGSLDAVISHWINGTPAPPDPAPGDRKSVV